MECIVRKKNNDILAKSKYIICASVIPGSSSEERYFGSHFSPGVGFSIYLAEWRRNYESTPAYRIIVEYF